MIDTGIGIRKADQVKLFKMFGKLKNSKEQNKNQLNRRAFLATAAGAAVGAAGGYIVDQRSKRSDTASENARLRAENEQLRQEADGI